MIKQVKLSGHDEMKTGFAGGGTKGCKGSVV